ncbi:MAG: hypothetical protein AAFV78_01825, partial [Bacteroidota bacterium]
MMMDDTKSSIFSNLGVRLVRRLESSAEREIFSVVETATGICKIIYFEKGPKRELSGNQEAIFSKLIRSERFWLTEKVQILPKLTVLVYPCLGGETLESIHWKDYHLQDFFQIFAGIIHGLKYLHSQQIILGSLDDAHIYFRNHQGKYDIRLSSFEHAVQLQHLHNPVYASQVNSLIGIQNGTGNAEQIWSFGIDLSHL